MNQNRILYLDVLKAFAICAVLVDHFRNLFPMSTLLGYCSFYSVSVFIIVAGISAYLSMPKHYGLLKNRGVSIFVRRRATPLLLTYMVACFLHYGFEMNWNFNDIPDFIHRAMTFAMPAPAYYIVVYVQMVLLSPVLYLIVKKCSSGRYSVLKLSGVLIVSLGLGYFLTQKGPKFPIYGGASILLGGSYLFLYVLGMGWCALDIPERIRQLRWGNLTGVALLIGCLAFVSRGKLFAPVFSSWSVNPPGIVLMIYAVAVTWCVTACVIYLEKAHCIMRMVFEPLALIGRNSLDIFLFHWFIYNVLVRYTPINASNTLERLLLFLIPLLLPIPLRWCWNKTKLTIREEFAALSIKENEE